MIIPRIEELVCHDQVISYNNVTVKINLFVKKKKKSISKRVLSKEGPRGPRKVHKLTLSEVGQTLQ